MCYHLHAPVLALKHDDGLRPHLGPLPAGTRIYLAGDTLDSGLIEVTDASGSHYTVFYSDLLERSKVERAGRRPSQPFGSNLNT